MSWMTLVLVALAGLAGLMDRLAPYSTASVYLVEIRSELGVDLWIPLAALAGLALVVDVRAAVSRRAAAVPPPDVVAPPAPALSLVDRVRELDLGISADVRSMPGIPLMVIFPELTPEQERRALAAIIGVIASAEAPSGLPSRVRFVFRNEAADRAGRLDATIHRLLGNTTVRVLANRDHVDLVFFNPQT